TIPRVWAATLPCFERPKLTAAQMQKSGAQEIAKDRDAHCQSSQTAETRLSARSSCDRSRRFLSDTTRAHKHSHGPAKSISSKTEIEDRRSTQNSSHRATLLLPAPPTRRPATPPASAPPTGKQSPCSPPPGSRCTLRPPRRQTALLRQ